MNLPLGTVITPNGLIAGLWALPRPMTRKWGSGSLQKRLESVWGSCSVIFGKQDHVEGLTVDNDSVVGPSVVADWEALPFADDSLQIGFWDPPYRGYVGPEGDVHYSLMFPALREICRVLSDKLFILSPMVYPNPKGWKRIAMLAITYGPRKIIRCLQGFELCK